MTVIDLAPYTTWLPAHLASVFAAFGTKHPDVQVSCVALYVTPYGGSAWINYETQEHSDAWVQKYKDDDPVYVRMDEAGSFCPFPNDFAFGQADDFSFPDFPDLYAATPPLRFRDARGRIHETSTADASIGRVLISFLRDTLQSFNQFGPLRRAQVFRMGLCIHNTDLDAFWVNR